MELAGVGGTFMRHASPNERRCITREDLRYYNSVVIGATYEFKDRGDLDLRSRSTYYWALTACIKQHPFLGVVIRQEHTEKPFYERASEIHLKSHTLIAGDLQDNNITKGIESVLASTALDRSWLGDDKPPWRIVVYPILSPREAKPSRCFIAFSFSHGLSDGLAGPAFHRTFLSAMSEPSMSKETPAVITPDLTLSAPFDTPERLPISWAFLLGPLLALCLPKFIANFLGLRASTTTIDERTWLGAPIFIGKDSSPTQLRILEIEASILQRSLQLARENGSKLTANLHQMIVRALSQSIPSPLVDNFVSQTAVNMRGSIGASATEMGMFVTGFYDIHRRVDGKAPFSTQEWVTARSMTKSLAESATKLQDQPIGLLRYAPSIRKYLTGKLGQKRDCSYELSNLLAFSNAPSDGTCKITNMIFSQPCGVATAPLTFSVISVGGGSLMIAVTWQPGALGSVPGGEHQFVQSICESIHSDFRNLT
ncbi:hypothetical protein JX265_010349 [Neoarthrinium moseri]|uniref:Alcohol acetyltransferase n=1 Tax=Neoarthrinium moseri TaxID=1658444 RepID=A0A9P9WE67_9PEZI|nr:hypothetical protein JX265_010349 [Neoarthrinium moseri]